MAYNPNNETSEALDYSAAEPISAVDKDGKEVNNTEKFKDLFRVDNTGKVYVNKPLKRDTFAVIRITVVVRNKSAPTIPEGKGLLIITIIDVNEFPPVSTLYPIRKKCFFKGSCVDYFIIIIILYTEILNYHEKSIQTKQRQVKLLSDKGNFVICG